MHSQDIRKGFLDFFEKRGHKIIPSSSLIPDDPSVLLTTAGMQQFKPYFIGKADPMRDFGSLRTASIQKAFRTSDMDEIGDESHLTFFEMLGHFSFGDYFKKETIEWTYELLTEVFDVSADRISASVFAGDETIPFDSESYETWSHKISLDRIKKGGREGNIWGPAGPEGPCGAANEVYVDDLEVATLVFMEYFCAKDGSLTPLPQKGVDVGWGLERLAMIVQGKKNIFETDLFSPLVQALPIAWTDQKVKRIVADHARAIVFLISDGVRPSNKDAGYILRRLLRRIIIHIHLKQAISFTGADTLPMGIETDLKNVLDTVLKIYQPIYQGLNKEVIFNVFDEERRKFGSAFKSGLREMKKLDKIDGQMAFKIYESYGLPFELIKEFGGEKTKNLTREDFDLEFKKHQKISRAGQEKKFGGHGLILDTGELKAVDPEELKKVTRLHTATHLLNAALRIILGPDIQQQGSDVTAERTRFDFTFPRRLTPEEIKKIEDWVNDVIGRDAAVGFEEVSYEEAIKSGAIRFWREKYPSVVKVYKIYDRNTKEVFSKELCGGPHVSRTARIGRFRIIKEESSSAGVRRIRGVVE